VRTILALLAVVMAVGTAYAAPPLPEDTAQKLAAKVSPEFKEWVFHSDRTIKDGVVSIISHATTQPPPERWLALATEVACRLSTGPRKVELGQLVLTSNIPEEIARDMAMMQTTEPDPDSAFRIINRRAYWFFDIEVTECPAAG
jgi:hypothetical protein